MARDSDEAMNSSTTMRWRGSRSVRTCIAFMRSARAACTRSMSACFMKSLVVDTALGCVIERSAAALGTAVGGTRPALIRKPPLLSHGIGMPLPLTDANSSEMLG